MCRARSQINSHIFFFASACLSNNSDDRVKIFIKPWLFVNSQLEYFFFLNCRNWAHLHHCWFSGSIMSQKRSYFSNMEIKAQIIDCNAFFFTRNWKYFGQILQRYANISVATVGIFFILDSFWYFFKWRCWSFVCNFISPFH